MTFKQLIATTALVSAFTLPAFAQDATVDGSTTAEVTLTDDGAAAEVGTEVEATTDDIAVDAGVEADGEVSADEDGVSVDAGTDTEVDAEVGEDGVTVDAGAEVDVDAEVETTEDGSPVIVDIEGDHPSNDVDAEVMTEIMVGADGSLMVKEGDETVPMIGLWLVTSDNVQVGKVLDVKPTADGRYDIWVNVEASLEAAGYNDFVLRTNGDMIKTNGVHTAMTEAQLMAKVGA